MKNLVVLFDMDDTLCDTTGQKERDLRKILKNESEIITDYLSPRCPPITRKLLRKIMSQPGWWENLPKLEDGFELYELARSEGFETGILTKGPETYPLAWTEKFAWRKRNTPESSFTITLDKSRYIGDVLVDDWPGYVDKWLETNQQGRAILPRRKYNEDYLHQRAIHYNGKNIDQIAELFRMLKTQN